MYFIYYLFLFYIYSILGWILETLYVSILNKKITDRGFLIGPYCPIYGIGALIIIIYLTQYNNNPLTVFLMGMILCSILEYFTSYIMEKLFKARWWDYSNNKYNLNGRICLKNSSLFGLSGIAVIYLTQPLINNILPSTTTPIIVTTIIFSTIFIIDLIISLKVVSSFKKTIKNIDFKKDSTAEFSKLVKETLHNKFFQKRLFTAFPNIDLSKLTDIKNEIIEIKDDLKNGLKERLKK